MSLRSEVEEWCQSYVSAFADYDAAGISAHWTYPALTTQAGRSFVFRSREHFTKNTVRLLAFYRGQSVVQVARTVIDVQSMHTDAVSMTVLDRMYTDSGEEIVRWQAAYVLQRVDGEWKAVMAVADGETEAWMARGTPLGG
ncbi:MAG: hypothetical protein AAF437_08715 [Pseudomonadota bacterium]